MIDFLLGCATVALAWFAHHHFTQGQPPVTNGLAATLLQGLKTLMTQAVDDIVAELQTIPGMVNTQVASLQGQVADLTAQLAAEKASRADDVGKIKSAADALVASLAPGLGSQAAPPPEQPVG